MKILFSFLSLVFITINGFGQEVWTTVSKTGYMVLNWKVDNPGENDFVALYDDNPNKKGTDGYLAFQWNWASKSNSYLTGTKEGFHYYVAYVAVDKDKKRSFKAIAGPATCLNNTNLTGDGYLNILNQCLIERYGKEYSGNAFALTRGNSLDAGWIAQTPKIWGKAANEVKPNAGIFNAEQIKSIISQAQHFVDITTLSPLPDKTFQAAILDGLTVLARNGRNVTVRILGGWPQSSTFEGVKSYLNSFADPISKIKENKLKIYVGAQRSSVISWNHAKMVAVDGKVAFVGGQNLWTGDYLGTRPVHDLNMVVHGPAAYYCHQFANLLWQGICKYEGIWMPWSWESGQVIDHRGCVDKINFTMPVGNGSVSILGVGRYGTMKDNSGATIQPSDFLMALTLNSASKTIHIAQQDLGFGILDIGSGMFWEDGMKAIAGAIVRGVDVYIVLSNDHSKGDPNPYSNVKLENTAKALRSYVRQQSNLSDKDLDDLLCQKLHLTSLRFDNTSNSWPDGVPFANHSKFFMVDEKVFYVGSANLYPSDLQEYGFFVSNPAAIAQIKAEYYNKLWEYSSRVAISGNGGKGCFFKN